MRDHEKPAESWPGGMENSMSVRFKHKDIGPGGSVTALIALSQMFITDVRRQRQHSRSPSNDSSLCLIWLVTFKYLPVDEEKNRKMLRKCWKIRPINAEEITFPLQLEIWLMAIR